ncbi:chemotaxis protein CheX [Cohnella mopanensis]|uniref:chemotaxis protein CheX n=1 Tax=Cohnella mopanensis TaxID=2911966 RepID=UPI001EF8E256|nr:chemotaxis protein CheX [Cohnella mopanensis]
MSSQEGVRDLVNSAVESLSQVIPRVTQIYPPKAFQQTETQIEMSVLIGITGEVSGRIVLEGESPAFSKLGEAMFGMPLEGEMLHSCVGEIANMIAGKTSSILFQKGHKIDITPPTVVVGKFQMFGFEKGISVLVHIADVGEVNMILLLQQ